MENVIFASQPVLDWIYPLPSNIVIFNRFIGILGGDCYSEVVTPLAQP